MNKFGLFLIGGVAALVLFANLGSMIGLAIGIAILYVVWEQFMKARSTGMKVMWGILGLFILSASASNFPAMIGIVAAFALYFVWKKWQEPREEMVEEQDPFENFEKQWAKLK